jgi:hypothetical protein
MPEDNRTLPWCPEYGAVVRSAREGHTPGSQRWLANRISNNMNRSMDSTAVSRLERGRSYVGYDLRVCLAGIFDIAGRDLGIVQ